MNYKFTLILLQLLVLPTSLFAKNLNTNVGIGLNEIIDRAAKKFDSASLPEKKRSYYELQSLSDSAFENPILSYGQGRLKYNGGSGTASYDEFSLNQRIPINGVKTNLRKQGEILGEIAEIDGSLYKLQLSARAMLAGLSTP